ncbi:DUF6443 domain-containing protein [Kordia sp.]|uniref:DUF6443 domain-containing protein n=1 Tax=Kordia sp. TaxID=1965332 RepID=UPI003D274298
MKKQIMLMMCVIFGLTVLPKLHAQDNPNPTELPTIIPASPTVANLMQFEEVPVSQYTGVPDIGIPLFGKQLAPSVGLNVSLRYNATGIRIDERSGWTGTGWSLDAGGAISRTVVGVPDEKNVPNQGIGVLHNNYFNYPFTNNPAASNEFLWKGVRGIERYDTQLDLYQFSYLGNSGRFVVIKNTAGNLEAKLLSYDQKLEIVLIYNPVTLVIDGFEIIDTSGTIYTFGQGEEYKEKTVSTPLSSGISVSGSSNVSSDIYYSAWMLKKVTTSNLKTLCEFEYSDIQENFETPENHTIKKVLGNPNTSDSDHSQYNEGLLESGNSYSASALEIQSKKLSRIILSKDNSSLDFTHSIGHPEYSGSITPVLNHTGAKLTQVQRKDANGAIVETFSFTYSQTTTGNRLFLNQVNHTRGNITLPYVMSYHNKENLPAFGDIQKNRWGYFNAGDVTTGVLTEMRYPTGGVKSFGFESNTFSYFGDQPVNLRDIPENQTSYTADYLMTDQLNPNSGFTPTVKFIYIEGRSTATTLNINSITTASNQPFGNELDNFHVKITPVTILESVGFDPDCTGFCQGPGSVSDFEPANYDNSFTYKVTTTSHQPILSTGWYFVELDHDQYISSNINEVTVDFSITYPKFTPNQKYFNGGGLRIGSIAFKDKDTVATKTHYDYTEFVDSTVSSGSFDGELYDKPYTISRRYTMINNINWIPSSVKYQVQNYSNAVNVQMTKGNYVGYQNVRVYKENNGATKYTFTSPKDDPTFTSLVYPFVPQPDLDHKRGLLTKQEIFDDDNRKLKEVINSYTSSSKQVATNVQMSLKQFTSCEWDQFFNTYNGYLTSSVEKNYVPIPFGEEGYIPPPIANNCGDASSYIDSHFYYYYAGISQLTETITNDYFYDLASNQNATTTRETFSYHPINFQLKEKHSFFDEKGTEQDYMTKYYYPVDTSFPSGGNSTTIRNALVSLNKINEVLETQSYKNGSFLNQIKTEYHEFETDLILPKIVAVSKGTDALENRLEYQRYDSYGNILQVSQTDGTPISYIWGYDQTFPVAQLIGVSFSEIETLLGNNFNTGSSGLSNTQISNLQTSFPETQFSHYTYDPMIGVISGTDARGYITTYVYDDFHRLKQVKDADGNILAGNEYFYRTSNDALDNYVKTIIYNEATQDGLNVSDWNTLENINYVDGLGRTKQSIAIGQGGNNEDIVTPFDYDAIGRKEKEFLPYATTSLQGAIHSNALVNQATFYNVVKYENTLNAYSEQFFEDSPLNRVQEVGAPGLDWEINKTKDDDHTIKMGYQTNSHNGILTDKKFDNVRRFKASFGSGYTDVSLQEDGFYLAGELYKSILKDENWQPNGTDPSLWTKDHTTEEFKNKLGQVLLKRTYNGIEVLDTYYIYDDFGNLTYVLPPEASIKTSIDTTVLDELCYQYKYDHRNRLIEKKIPAKGWEYIVYNKLDRPVLTQDINLRTINKWLFTKYDAFGRIAYTGTMTNDDHIDDIRQGAHEENNLFETRTVTVHNYDGTDIYYTADVYPQGDENLEILTVNYYDDYLWSAGSALEADYNLDTQSGLDVTGNTISKPANASTGWNTGFTTAGYIYGDGYIQYKVTSTDKKLMVGLSAINSAENDHYDTIDYAIYTGYGGLQRVYLYQEGVFESLSTTTYQVGDVFKVERSANQILFKKNDEIFHAVATTYTGVLIGDASFFDPEVAIEDMHIGYASYGQAFSANVKGLATGSKVRVLGTDKWITSESYYDEKGRPIHGVSKNEYLHTQDVSSSLLDFSGKVLAQKTTHLKEKNNPIVTIDNYSYDKSSRLLYQTKQINGGNKELIAKNNYDELGQLVQKQVGGSLPSISTYTHVNSNLNVSGNIIEKTAGSTSTWDAGLVTDTTINGDGYVSFSPVKISDYLMAGLSDDISGTDHYNSIDYAIYVYWGNINIYESGTNKGLKGNYVLGDVLKVERRDNKIYYLKNEEVFYISEFSDNGNPLVGDVCINSSGGKVQDLVLIDLEKQLQEVDYTYNIRGWLKGINNVNDQGNDLFSFALKYNDITDPTRKLFNGNISSTLWRTKGADSSLKNYEYDYDPLNRITSAKDNTGNYSLDYVDYDLNGNIEKLVRIGHTDANATVFGIMDDLNYFYVGNQLMSVADASNIDYGFKNGNTTGDDYSYDANGNMIEDKNKDITNISYNYLNLPEQITFVNESTISYIYDATGMKQEKIVFDSSLSSSQSTFYAGNYIYKKGSAQSPVVLTFFNSEEGYIEPVVDNEGGGNRIVDFDYTYQYKDHLGNIRLSYQDMDANGTIDPITEIKEENHYYPFGLEHKGYNNVVSANSNSVAKKFKYANKEKEEELGLNTIAYGWRDYDPAKARFNKIDRFAEKYYSDNPYHFTKNNPISNREIQGDSVWVFTEAVRKKGVIVGHHAFLRVQTDKQDVIVELWGQTDPDTGQQLRTGIPRVDGFSWSNVNGRSAVSSGDLIEPKGDNDNYEFENSIIEFANYFKNSETTVDGKKDFANLPDYNAFGPNSNSFVKSLVKNAGGVDLKFPISGIGANKTEFYDRAINNYMLTQLRDKVCNSSNCSEQTLKNLDELIQNNIDAQKKSVEND